MTTYTTFASTQVALTPMAWSSAVISAREYSLPVAAGPVKGEFGWQLGRGSQGRSRPAGYHGRHGRHPGYRRGDP